MNSRAVAVPMPLAAPVMTATFPASLCDDDRESAAVVEKRLAATPRGEKIETNRYACVISGSGG
jgi:hypothetical protein